MRRVTVNCGNVGLVIRKGKIAKVLEEGRYWIKATDEFYSYDMTKQFCPSIDLDILLKNIKINVLLDIIEISDNEIGLQYINGNYKYVLQPGRYAFWKGFTEFKCIKADVSNIEIPENIDRSIFEKAELKSYVRNIIIEPFEKALLFVDEVFVKVIEPGNYYFWKNNTGIEIFRVDLRSQQMEISGQELLTQDKAAIRINFYANYKVVDILKALKDNNDFRKQLYVLMQLALREYIGTMTLDEILSKKEGISEYVSLIVVENAKKLGVEVSGCGVKDIILPGDIKEIMNQVLVAQKRAQANIITRREETASTRSLLNTARLMEENEMLYKLKEMEYVEKIADKINTISVSGGNQVVEQLKEIFVPNSKK